MRATIWWTAAVMTVATTIALSDEPEPAERGRLIVPARVLLPPPPPETDADSDTEPAMAETETEEMSGGVSPQYRSRRVAEPNVASEEPYVRFILPLSDQPILVEVSLVIDRLPFRMIREQRVDRILAELANPPAVEPVAQVNTEVSSTADSETTAAKVQEPAEESDSPAETETGAEDEPAEADEGEATPPAAPPRDNSITGRLRRYTAATRRTPTRDEIHWLLNNWDDGPTLLLLNDNFQRIRARQTPVFKVLDRDEDRVLSDAELATAQATLLSYDRDQNDLLTYTEIAAAADRTLDRSESLKTLPPVIYVADLTNPQVWLRLTECYSTDDNDGGRKHLARFDPDGNGSVDASELAGIRAMTPDIRVDVAFDLNSATDSELEVVDVASALGDVAAVVRGDAVVLQISNTLVEFSAVQTQSGPGSDQISMGAVRDGYPLLPELDLNDDGRLTIRELWSVQPLLGKFDLDQDGQITFAEIPTTLRISFGHGPIVHQHLSTVRSVHTLTIDPKVTPPDWFVRSDVNGDGDLTVREFLGNKAQFAALDVDGDGLMSAAEAALSEKKKSETETTDNESN